MATIFFYIYVMATSFFYIYVMATNFFYIYVMATSFFPRELMSYILPSSSKLTIQPQPVVVEGVCLSVVNRVSQLNKVKLVFLHLNQPLTIF